jgi:hypothetical protein
MCFKELYNSFKSKKVKYKRLLSKRELQKKEQFNKLLSATLYPTPNW